MFFLHNVEVGGGLLVMGAQALLAILLDGSFLIDS